MKVKILLAVVLCFAGQALRLGSVQALAQDSSNVRTVGFYDTPGFARGVAISGNYAFVADGSTGLRVIDISNPVCPMEVGFLNAKNYNEGVAISGSYAYVADGTSGMRVIDVSNPNSPTEIGYYDTPNYASGVAVSGNYAYVADLSSNSTLRIIDISNPVSPIQVGAISASGLSYDVTVFGDYAFVAYGYYGPRMFDISDPAHLSEKTVHFSISTCYGVEVSGNYVYVAVDTAGMLIYDINDPLNWVKKCVYNTPGGARRIAVDTNYVCVADGPTGLRVINASNPATPSEIGYYNTPGWATDVLLAGNYIYVADGNAGLRIYQYYSSPSSIHLSNLSAIQASEAGILVNWRTESEDGCLCYKIERSQAADNGYSEIGMVQGNGTTATAHDYSFIDSGIKASGTYYYRLTQVDMSGERTYYGPVQVDVSVDGRKEMEQTTVRIRGNTVEYTVDQPGLVSLKIYNLLGQEVNNLVRGSKPAGSYKITWNGRDDSGRKVSSGVYLVRLESNGQAATGKMLVLK